MKKFSLALFLVISGFVWVQAQNYIEYHRSILQIEEYVLVDAYAPALVLFDSLFEQYEFVYAIDCFTAAQLATLEAKPTQAFFFLEKGILRGLSWDLIAENGILNPLQSEKEWLKLKAAYPELRMKYENSIDQELCREVQKLYEIDLAKTEELKAASLVWEQIVYPQWRKQVRRNMEVLLAMIKEKGFPGEKIIGLDECLGVDYDMAAMPPKLPVIGRNVLLNSKMAFLMTVHYFSDPHQDFNDLLLEEVKKGNLPPGHYAAINDFQAKYGKQKYGDYEYYNQWHKDDRAKRRSIKKVNKRRAAIGLGSYQHKRLKRKRWLRARAQKKENELVYIRP